MATQRRNILELKSMCQRQASGSGSFIFQVQSLVGIMEKHYKMMIIYKSLSKYYDMVNMGWLFVTVAVVLCGVYGQVIYKGLVVDMVEFYVGFMVKSYINVIVEVDVHMEKNTVDMVDIVLVRVMVVHMVEILMMEILMMHTHMLVMVNIVDKTYLEEHRVNLVKGYITNMVKEHIEKGGSEGTRGETDEGSDRKMVIYKR
eukprot:546586_1